MLENTPNTSEKTGRLVRDKIPDLYKEREYTKCTGPELVVYTRIRLAEAARDVAKARTTNELYCHLVNVLDLVGKVMQIEGLDFNSLQKATTATNALDGGYAEGWIVWEKVSRNDQMFFDTLEFTLGDDDEE